MDLYLKTKDYFLSQEEFELWHDKELDMLVTRPQPKDVARYYESTAYISHSDAKNSIRDRLYQKVRQFNLRRKLTLVDRLAKGQKSILDIGAGTGDFLWGAKKNGWNIAGVEPNFMAREKAATKGVVLQGNLDDVSNSKYKVITLWHVLEHLPDLERQIIRMDALLHSEGFVIVAVPNFKSFDAGFYKKFWAGYDVPRHLWHFSKSSIKEIFKKHGLEVIKVKPLWFDSFYVSLLSENYKNGRQHWLRAFLVGLWSNLQGLFTKEYSSHLYILKKRP